MKYTVVLFFVGLSFISCTNNGNKVSKQSGTPIQPFQLKSVNVNIDKFSTLPKEIDGCGCYFYISEKDKKDGNYICANDFANLAFLSIEGKLEKFALTKHAENSNVYLYTNGTFILKIEITKKEIGEEEVSNVEGIITVKTKQGKEFKKTFIGYCGC